MRIKMIERRKELGMTQEELANKLGIGRTAVSAWEIGRNEPPLEFLIKLKKIFGVSEDEFFLDTNDTNCIEGGSHG
jgi:transcriptional regulator with XRE-family HTH domain